MRSLTLNEHIKVTGGIGKLKSDENRGFEHLNRINEEFDLNQTSI